MMPLNRTFLATLALVVALATCVAIGWTSLQRGPWYDEFYTQFVTRPDIGWGDALRTSWLPDNHPPLYYVLARLTSGWGDLATHRLVNVAIGAVAVGLGAAVVRDAPRMVPAAACAMLLLAGNTWTVIAGTELRSYFLSLCAGGLFALALLALWIEGNAGSPWRRTAYVLAAMAAFNTHIITTIVAGALVTPFLLTALVQRNWTLARGIGLPAAAAAIVFVATAAVQLPYWQSNTRVFWIPAGLDAARAAISYAVQRTLEANLAVLALALAGLALWARDWLRERRIAPEAVALALLVAGTALAAVALIGLHLVRPVIIEKYLTGLVGAIAVGVALAAGAALAVAPRRLAVAALIPITALSGINLAHNLQMATVRHSWFGTGQLIAAQVRHCPTTVVHTDPFWNAEVMAIPPADNRAVVPWAYRTVAREFGFAIEPAASLRLGVGCPTLFWAEHDARHAFDEATIIAHLRARGFALASVHVQRIGDGWVASDRPLQ